MKVKLLKDGIIIIDLICRGNNVEVKRRGSILKEMLSRLESFAQSYNFHTINLNAIDVEVKEAALKNKQERNERNLRAINRRNNRNRDRHEENKENNENIQFNRNIDYSKGPVVARYQELGFVWVKSFPVYEDGVEIEILHKMTKILEYESSIEY